MVQPQSHEDTNGPPVRDLKRVPLGLEERLSALKTATSWLEERPAVQDLNPKA